LRPESWNFKRNPQLVVGQFGERATFPSSAEEGNVATHKNGRKFKLTHYPAVSLRHKLSYVLGLFSKPFGLRGSSIKNRCRLEGLELPSCGRGGSF
jgi:hypothetical protein